MGYALAEAAIEQGAEVTLVSGPVCIKPPAQAQLLRCMSAHQMLQQVMGSIQQQDIFIACAAVADYRVEQAAEHKIKKTQDELTLKLVKNPDILKNIAAMKKRPFCVGFAAETHDLEQYARRKLQNKNLDMIAANLVSDENSGFDVDTNALSVFWPGGRHELPQQSKTIIATKLIAIIADLFNRPPA